ncbi:PAS domain-containing sensor histidine kinase [Halodesulfurarchaeum sp. HSR-GB]|uniref:sensor histidine kinase n=1 Tax=Halodesulfurarchaeum sp. HSR-GB TaxID=3074077 RepID=UPI00285E1AC8|nr:PAS domain-containing sensor histidine kinase [Halodesulfurarchaeum sp. HSR-GB]MDR5656578.1 PAS domain-containing sensor histidine kinase [Halodesulfurarchaeum sp. HSR-GB]
MDRTSSDSQLLDRIFETSPTGLVVLAPEGEITRCNDRAEQLLGLEESEIEGKRYVEPEWTFTDEDGNPVPESAHPFVRVRDSGGPIFGQVYRMERPHADPIVVSISGAPITADGTVTRIVFAFEDITERRERERELEVMTRQLEVLNRVVRHDIRNEMAVVLGSIETAADRVSDPDTITNLERAQQAGDHVVSITKTARDLMEVVTATEPPELDPIQVAPILEEEVAMVREGNPDATVRIEGSIPSVSVRGTELLDSVFRNLLSNAVDHSDQEAPTVTVSASVQDDRLRVSVADDGPGIPEAQKWSIFGKGDRGLESDGTGIGLYLVENLVTQFGGDVWVEDNEPRGAVFVVELDIVE